MKKNIGRPKQGKEPRVNKVSFRISNSAKNGALRLMNNSDLNSAINSLLENLDSNLIYVSHDEKELLQKVYGIEAISFYSKVILNDLNKARDIEKSNLFKEDYVDIKYSTHDS
ncbi:hypothetical protein [Pseudoalteromonas arctica]|uniref:hypothetical protein n=1 Tax=Pseudoalteromonas arctica TaxID=394751 RepID=UPI00026D1127|nr:hypothetical protein [Pseudoalteromonas arctica]